MVKYFKFKKDYIINETVLYTEGVELKITLKNGIEYVFDGCFPLFKVHSETAKRYGEIVDRLW